MAGQGLNCGKEFNGIGKQGIENGISPLLECRFRLFEQSPVFLFNRREIDRKKLTGLLLPFLQLACFEPSGELLRRCHQLFHFRREDSTHILHGIIQRGFSSS